MRTIFSELSDVAKSLRNIDHNIERIVHEMAISRQQLDDDLAALVTAIGALIAAVQALPQPGDADFTAEDQSVQQAAAAVQAEINALNPPPPPGPQP